MKWIYPLAAAMALAPRLDAQLEVPTIPFPKKPSEEAAAAKAVSAPQDGGDSARIAFLNGDVLSGELVRASAEEIEWKSPASKSNILFDKASVMAISFPAAPEETTEDAAMATAIFKNGDTVSGKMLSLDDKTLRLDTAHAGELSISRGFISAISSSKSMPVLYKGPREGDPWVKAEHSNAGYSISDGCLVLQRNCAAGIEIGGGDMLSISFEVSIGSAFNMALFTSKVAAYGEDGYMLSFNQNYINMQTMSRRGGSRNIGNAQLEDLPSKPFVKFTMLVNRKSRSFILRIEDKTIQKWFDNNKAAGGLGPNIVFMHTHGAQRIMRLRNIVFSEWDGREDDGGGDEEKASTDTVLFTNKDKASGKIVGISGGELSFKTDFATLKIPTDRIARMLFSPAEGGDAKRQPGSVTAIFSNNDRLSFKMLSAEGGILKADCPFFGETSFKMRFCTKLVLEDRPAPGKNDEDVDKDAGNPDDIVIVE